jgi:hypothetical protein
MPIYSVKVEFIVEADQIESSSPEQVACDYVQNLIDEGYQLQDLREWSLVGVEQRDWSFLSVEPIKAANH